MVSYALGNPLVTDEGGRKGAGPGKGASFRHDGGARSAWTGGEPLHPPGARAGARPSRPGSKGRRNALSSPPKKKEGRLPPPLWGNKSAGG